MILAWMLSATLFGVCVALTAGAAERLVGAAGKPVRWVWFGALVTTATWPVLSALITRVSVRMNPRTIETIAAVRVLPNGESLAASGAFGAAGIAPLVVVLWALASLLLATRLLRSVHAARRWRITAECQLVDGVPVLITERVGPATVGLRAPSVLVPRALLDLEAPLRRLVLRHELEHCSANDPCLLAVCAAIVALFPWNPALWLIARRLHLAMEVDCDARVLAWGAEPTRYGKLLLMIAQRIDPGPLAPTLAGSPSHLERRIVAIQARHARRRPRHLAAAGMALVLGILGACSSGAPDVTPSRSVTIPSEPTRLDAEAPLLESQVDSAVRQIAGTGTLRYPAAMRAANREGEVLAQFVVDAEGNVEMPSFKAINSTDPAFTEAVRAALPTMRFYPATLGGKPVKQLVQQPFMFGLQRRQ